MPTTAYTAEQRTQKEARTPCEGAACARLCVRGRAAYAQKVALARRWQNGRALRGHQLNPLPRQPW